MTDPFAPIGIDRAPAKPRTRDVDCVMPVPDHGPMPPAEHPSLGRPAGRWTYNDAAGRLLGLICRFDRRDGKEFRPLTQWRTRSDGRLAWRWESWPAPRPIYGLDRLAACPRARVIVTEGEKAADAAGRLLPQDVVVTSPNGAKSTAKVDWTPLRGRDVVVWPDADAAGAAYAEMVAKLAVEAGVQSVSILDIPTGVMAGWDAADAEAEGWTTNDVRRLIDAARSVRWTEAPKPSEHRRPGCSAGSHGDGEKPEASARRGPAKRDQLMSLTNDIGLWCDEAGDGYATIPVHDHYENWPLNSRVFKRWLSARSYTETATVPGTQAIDDTVRVLEARAHAEGVVRRPSLRVADVGDKTYLDLVTPQWDAVEIDRDGWSLVPRAPAAFVRTGQMRSLPMPEGGSDIRELRRFVNVDRDEDFVLLVAWIIAALRATGPYPVLVLSGEQGTGKSTVSRLVRSMIDPNAAPIRAAPKDDRDLVVAAVNAHVIALDNLSSVPNWLSDALCRLSTGGGFASRMLHTDREESVMQAMRPIILNGIPALTERPDLASRAVTVRLQPISSANRMTEVEFWRDWEIVWPRVLGVLLDGVSTGLRRLDEVVLTRTPRMADFARFVVAAEPGLGFEPGSFIAAYEANQSDVAETSFEADPVAVAIRDLIRRVHPRGWHGTATELLTALNTETPEGVKRLKLWPQSAASLGNRIDRVAPLLRGQGFRVDRRHSGIRTISIAPAD